MSTDVLPLDPDRISALEPTEGDERELFMLSPFAVPRGMMFNVTAKGVTDIHLKYSGGKGDEFTEVLDALGDPKVTLVLSQPDQKVMSIRFDRPVGKADLATLADRFEMRATSIQNTAKRLSYKMTAQVVRMWLVPIAEEAVASVVVPKGSSPA